MSGVPTGDSQQQPDTQAASAAAAARTDTAVDLSKCIACGAPALPHLTCKKCGQVSYCSYDCAGDFGRLVHTPKDCLKKQKAAAAAAAAAARAAKEQKPSEGAEAVLGSVQPSSEKVRRSKKVKTRRKDKQPTVAKSAPEFRREGEAEDVSSSASFRSLSPQSSSSVGRSSGGAPLVRPAHLAAAERELLFAAAGSPEEDVDQPLPGSTAVASEVARVQERTSEGPKVVPPSLVAPAEEDKHVLPSTAVFRSPEPQVKASTQNTPIADPPAPSPLAVPPGSQPVPIAKAGPKKLPATKKPPPRRPPPKQALPSQTVENRDPAAADHLPPNLRSFQKPPAEAKRVFDTASSGGTCRHNTLVCAVTDYCSPLQQQQEGGDSTAAAAAPAAADGSQYLNVSAGDLLRVEAVVKCFPENIVADSIEQAKAYYRRIERHERLRLKSFYRSAKRRMIKRRMLYRVRKLQRQQAMQTAASADGSEATPTSTAENRMAKTRYSGLWGVSARALAETYLVKKRFDIFSWVLVRPEGQFDVRGYVPSWVVTKARKVLPNERLVRAISTWQGCMSYDMDLYCGQVYYITATSTRLPGRVGLVKLSQKKLNSYPDVEMRDVWVHPQLQKHERYVFGCPVGPHGLVTPGVGGWFPASAVHAADYRQLSVDRPPTLPELSFLTSLPYQTLFPGDFQVHTEINRLYFVNKSQYRCGDTQLRLSTVTAHGASGRLQANFGDIVYSCSQLTNSSDSHGAQIWGVVEGSLRGGGWVALDDLLPIVECQSRVSDRALKPLPGDLTAAADIPCGLRRGERLVVLECTDRDGRILDFSEVKLRKKCNYVCRMIKDDKSLSRPFAIRFVAETDLRKEQGKLVGEEVVPIKTDTVKGSERFVPMDRSVARDMVNTGEEELTPEQIKAAMSEGQAGFRKSATSSSTTTPAKLKEAAR